MPNITTTMYLRDEDYARFLERKTEILHKMREVIREELGIEKKGD